MEFKVNFGDNSIIKGKQKQLQTNLNTFDALEYDCYELVEKYAKKFDLEIIKEEPDSIDFDIAKRMQDLYLFRMPRVINEKEAVMLPFYFRKEKRMKLKCAKCQKEYEGRINKTEQLWFGTCPYCGMNFHVDIPNGRILMAFTDPLDTIPTDPYFGVENLPEEIDIYRYFTEDFPGQGIHTLYVFKTIDEFMKKWTEIIDEPNGMWYWVIDEGAIVCSGAMDPGDFNIFTEFWNLEEEKYVL